MKKLLREYSFDAEQLNNIRALARELNLTMTTVKLLVARGVDTAEKITEFLSPSKEHFLSPFLMRGMREATEMLRRAKEEEWNVAVFGDYDADGVCASTIMSCALRAFGIEPRVYIPERADGYGLSVAAVDRIFEEFIPDLLITVDCGISNYKEVEYVQEQGTEVIVTDHHELPEVLPACTIINPKLQDDYPYDNLCGAGVAFKVACALLGDRAYDLLDFAALATVADSVPLLGENRDIVHEGLKKINTAPRLAFSLLLGKAQGEAVTAQTLAFTVAPRINAAGRMGNAACALQLFLSEDPAEIERLAAKLGAYNQQRQARCDELYESAKAKLSQKGAYGHVIMLADSSWNSGFVGIVAARIAEEYARPALLFVQNGNAMKGSARSIENVNIFDALRHCSEYIEEFGGHSQAAGINITEENFARLEAALDEYIGANYKPEDFVPKLYISEEVEGTFSLQLAHELNALEPYGVGHRKPLFCLRAGALTARPVKAKSPHLVIRNPFIELMYFNGEKQLRLIESDVKKLIVFDCNCSVFRGKESVKGFVREIVYDGKSSTVPVWRFSASLDRLCTEQGGVEGAEYLSEGELNDLVARKRQECNYGLCLVAHDPATAERFPALAGMTYDLIYPSSKNVANTLLLSPAADTDLSGYRDIVFLDAPPDFHLIGLKSKRCYVNRERKGYRALLALDVSRETLLRIFAALRANAGGLPGGNAEETAVASGGMGVSVEECMFALRVFEQLGLISYERGTLSVYRGVHADLKNSILYRKIVALQEK